MKFSNYCVICVPIFAGSMQFLIVFVFNVCRTFSCHFFVALLWKAGFGFRWLIFDIDMHLKTWGLATFYGVVLKSSSHLGSLLWLCLIVMWLLFQLRVALCLPLSILKLILWQEMFLVIFLIKEFIVKNDFYDRILLFWPLILQIISWLRNSALTSTSFHVVTWWSSGNTSVYPFPCIWFLEIMFAFICHIFLFIWCLEANSAGNCTARSTSHHEPYIILTMKSLNLGYNCISVEVIGIG